MKPEFCPLFESLCDVALSDLVKQLSTYGFTDPLGHPLHNCAEFTELVRRAAKAVAHV